MNLGVVAALVAALVSSVAWGQEVSRYDRGSRRYYLANDGSSAVFRLLYGGSGIGTANVDGFCEAFASEMVGNSFCLDSSGSTGPLTLSAVGSPTQQTDAVCSNGPDCAPMTSTRTSAGNRYQTTSTAPTGAGSALSFCALVSPDSTGSTQQFLTRNNGVQSTYDFGIAGGSPVLIVYATGSGIASAGTVAAGAWTFLCGTYDGVTTKLWQDGANTGTSGSATGPVQDVTGAAHAVGDYGNGAQPFTGRIAVAFFTAKTLSPDTIAAMSSSILPTLTGTRGEPVMVTRTTPRSCDGTTIAPNRACVYDGALSVWGDGTQLLARSAEFNQAPWEADTGVVVTANAGLAPDGTMTAETINNTAGVSSGGTYQQVTFSPSAGPFTASVWSDKSGDFSIAGECVGGSPVSCVCARADGGSCSTVSSAAVCAAWTTGSGTPVRLSATYTCSASSGLAFIKPTPGIYGTSTGTAKFWGAMLNTGPIAAPYCASGATAPVICSKDVVTVPSTGWPVSQGSVAISFTPGWDTMTTGLGYAAGFLSTADGSNGWDLGVNYFTEPDQLSLRLVNTGDTTGSPLSATLTWVPGQRYRIAAAWGGGSDARIWRDGVLVASSNSYPMVPAIGLSMHVGSNYPGVNQSHGLITIECVSQSPERCR